MSSSDSIEKIESDIEHSNVIEKSKNKGENSKSDKRNNTVKEDDDFLQMLYIKDDLLLMT